MTCAKGKEWGVTCSMWNGSGYCPETATSELWAPKEWGGPDESLFVCEYHLDAALAEGWTWPGW